MSIGRQICDAIGCSRQAIYVREHRRGLGTEYVCSLCHNRRIADSPSDASLYHFLRLVEVPSAGIPEPAVPLSPSVSRA